MRTGAACGGVVLSISPDTWLRFTSTLSNTRTQTLTTSTTARNLPRCAAAPHVRVCCHPPQYAAVNLFYALNSNLAPSLLEGCTISCCLVPHGVSLQLVAAVLRLNAPWIPSEPDRHGDLAISRGSDDVLTYDDGISLRIEVLDPVRYKTVEDLVVTARDAAGPGRLALVAGAVPVEWRATLRQAELSFIDVDGVVEIAWPRLRVSTSRFGKEIVRHRGAVPLQKGHALVAEELLISSVDGTPPTITELARRAGVDKSIASRAVAQLARQGLVAREQSRRRVLSSSPTQAAWRNCWLSGRRGLVTR